MTTTFPAQDRLRPAAAGDVYRMDEVDNLLARSALNFRSQKDTLADIPPRPREGALQIYYW